MPALLARCTLAVALVLLGGCASFGASFAARQDDAAFAQAEADSGAPVEATFVTVRRGDTLSAIAARFYGDSARGAQIAQENAIANPDMIHPGQVLRLSYAPTQMRASHAAFSSTPLNRRAFTPHSRRQSDMGLIRASMTDPSFAR